MAARKADGTEVGLATELPAAGSVVFHLRIHELLAYDDRPVGRTTRCTPHSLVDVAEPPKDSARACILAASIGTLTRSEADLCVARPCLHSPPSPSSAAARQEGTCGRPLFPHHHDGR